MDFYTRSGLSNMTNKKSIIWEKWKDHFGFDEEDEILSNSLNEPEYDDEENEESEEIDAKSQVKSHIQKSMLGAVKVIGTPMGIIPLNENTSSSKIFNFWVGHSNFNISKKIAETIEKTSGVETLDVFTRYRFRIAVGKAFKDSEVMREINNKVYEEIEDGT